MRLEDALNTFAVRLYEWSVIDFTRELREDCPLLRSICEHNRSIGGFVLWNKTLSAGDQSSLAKALTLLNHENARNLIGGVITREIERWGEACYEQVTLHQANLPPLLTADTRLPTFRPPDVKVLFDTLACRISPTFGECCVDQSNLVCARRIGDWRIVTTFEFANREKNLAFSYQFIRQDGQPVLEAGFGPFPRNLLAFYGLYPHTVVGVPSQADVNPMVNAMVKLAEHFVSRVDPLFSGLGITD